MPIVEASNKNELYSRLGPYGSDVSGRLTRTKDEKEAYCLRRYVLTLAAHGLLPFPLSIEKTETPDFIVMGVEAYGIEVVEATDPNDQREYTLAARSGNDAWFDGDFGGRGKGGFIGDRPEQLWLAYVRQAIENKLRLKFRTPSTRILIYSNSNAGGHVDDVVACRVLRTFLSENFDASSAWKSASDISIIKGGSLIYDAGRSPRLLAIVQ